MLSLRLRLVPRRVRIIDLDELLWQRLEEQRKTAGDAVSQHLYWVLLGIYRTSW